jgi:hypothetical protein
MSIMSHIAQSRKRRNMLKGNTLKRNTLSNLLRRL